MKLHVTFKQQNPDFDQKYANEFHGGKESDGNWKDIWSEAYKVPFSIDKIAVIEKGELILIGRKESEEKINTAIPNMAILECYIKDEVKVKFAVSKELILNIHKTYNEKYDTTRYYFYLKPRTDYIKLTDIIYVLEKDIPELLKKN